MPTSDSERSDTVMVGRNDVYDFNEDNILPLPANDLNAIREWLQPTPYDAERSEFLRHLESYLPGTGQWLISTKTYQEWHSGDTNGLLWIKGIPGSGKSVMAASIIQKLREEHVPVLYFFFRQIIDANHQPVAVLRDWLCQILPFSPPLQTRLKVEYLDNRRAIDSVSAKDMWEDIRFALSAFSKAYCVIDALDEMDQGNDDFLQSVVELGQWRPANLKVLISSRPVVAVETPLRLFSVPFLRLDEQLVDTDIAAYVRHRLKSSAVSEEYWSIITEAIPGRANGLFLYARLSLDAFTKPGADPQDVLERLPTDLNVMYDDLLREHSKRSNVPNNLQLLILQSITHATRPLRLLEVAEMIKATHGPLETCSLKEIKNLVRAACGPLLQILHDETVSVVHHSFTEFLKGLTRSCPLGVSAYPILEAGPTNHRLAIACLDYLMSGCLETVQVKKRSDLHELYSPKKAAQSELRLKFPFIEYAAANWYTHIRRAELAGVDLSSLYSTLDEFVASKQRFVAWLDIDWPGNEIQGLTPLHAAAKSGLAQYAVHLIQKSNDDANAKSHKGDTPLYWAASSGHADVAQLLVDNGADPDGECNEGLKPLHRAASKNCAEVVKVLLASGVDPMTPKTREAPGRRCGNMASSVGHTPLMYACQNGHTKAVAEFLPYLDEHTIKQALFWSSGHAANVAYILKNVTVDVNMEMSGQTLLFKACLSSKLDAVKVLLAAGADPNILCSTLPPILGGMRPSRRHPTKRVKQQDEPRGFTALHALTGINSRYERPQSSVDCVSAIIQAGADIHVRSTDGKTALHFACANNVSIVKLLLEAGSDPYATDDNGDTILHTDGANDKELLPVLHESGLVDVNKIMIESSGGPLFTRLQSNHPESALGFLRYTSNLNMTTSDGYSPLHFFLGKPCSNHNFDVLNGLLSAGVDPNLRNKNGDAALHLVKSSVGADTIRALIKAGADLEIRDAQGQTPLFKAVTYSTGMRNKTDLFKTLIELGARTDTRDDAGRTLLHQVVKNIDRLEELILLVKFDPSVVDNDGNTLFHELVSRQHPPEGNSIYERLIDLGVDITQPNNRGRTILHELSSHTSGRRSSDAHLDYVLQRQKNKSPQDVDGIQPLHMAAAVSEVNVFKLLNSGADLFGTTKAGMTVLHVAAQARNPGVIDLVLARIVDLDDNTRKAFINQKSGEGNTALHYACSSGRPETVRFLLNAGADPNMLGKNGYPPLRACAEFEVEQALCTEAERRERERDQVKVPRKVSIRPGAFQTPPVEEGGGRIQWRSNNVNDHSDSTRLDEILDDLVLHGAQDTLYDSLRDALHDAVSNERDYTADCLLRLQSRLSSSVDLMEASRSEFPALFDRLQSARSSLMQENEKRQNMKATERSLNSIRFHYILKLLGHRQYGLLKDSFTERDISLLQSGEISLFHIFVGAGLSGLLGNLGTPEIAQRFDDHEWCGHAEEVHMIHRNSIKPLLIVACNRQLPNMDVIRVLVENMGIDINAKSRKEIWETGTAECIDGNGALHDLAEGRTWWNVHHALPYLIKKGADLELRTGEGDTPLHVACESYAHRGAFHKEAAKTLLDHGADVNAINAKGETCLSKAGTNVELIKMLLSYGAKVSAVAIFRAIELGNVELLGHFLPQGDLANVRRDDSETPPKRNFRPDSIRLPKAEVYPLFHAATCSAPRSHAPPQIDFAPLRSQMMTLLLEHGADPYATFVKFHRVPRDSIDADDESDDSEAGPADEWNTEICTVIHEILMTGDTVEPLLQLPSLQLETRDDKGRTLILCTNRIARIQTLFDLGADITAQDKAGKTVAHNIIKCRSNDQNISTLKSLLAKAPSLVQMGDQAGDTPLHYALKEGGIDFKHVSLLLEHGADPLQPDSNGNTALHFLATSPLRHKEYIHRFIDLGVAINSRNKEGNTPLFQYLLKGRLRGVRMFGYMHPDDEHDDNESLRFLKDLGADFFALNNVGMSLLHVVAGRKVSRTGFSRLDETKEPVENLVKWFEFLQAMGLDPMLEDSQQRTPLDFAAACGNEHILKLFNHKDGRE